MVDNTTTGDRSPNPQETRMSYISEGSSSGGSSRTSIDSDEALGLSRGAFVSYPNPSTGNLSMIEEERVRKNIFPPRPPGAQREHDNTSIQDYNNERALWDEISQYSLLSPRKRSQASDSPPQSPVGSPRPGSHPHPRPQRPIPSKVGIPALLGGESPPSSSQAGFAGIGAHGGIHKWALNVGEMNPPMGYNFDHRPITRLVRASTT
ncbi:hypothetical protein M408DRAFT_91760 [Serendipita vermifera MAFF 305830]|uniref:Uncharacterized protein n=1 Tax=Serendipita vermifera MAFF 305830 TaxID=933852 RepID=A0A0C3BS19_SERVB|nr:hypothetical protein M408DRAFT_91760 [Serendipita vermifera MAFF 305830]